MKILAIETSCDDTGIAILQVSETCKFKVLANIVSSQTEIHKKYGGVYPAMAKREHQRNLAPALIKALKKSELLKSQIPNSKSQSNRKSQTIKNILEREPELTKKLIPFLKKPAKPDIDLIAVTNGPGLEPCLWVGINFAKALSYFWDIPIVPVNHIEGHILVNFLENKNIAFPTLALVVSGGHTQLILMERIGKYKILGETRDDAAGECFDKCAKILGLGYPGGPIISKLAAQAVIPSLTGNPELTARNLDSRFRGNDISLPRPMINSKDYDFSFSGLKTAVLYAWQKTPASAKKSSDVARMANEIQQAIIDVLIKKTIKAVKDFKVKTLILGGGVTANQELRKQFLQIPGICNGEIKLLVPEPKLSTDNGLMVAVAGYFKSKQNKLIKWQDIEANANLRVE